MSQHEHMQCIYLLSRFYVNLQQIYDAYIVKFLNARSRFFYVQLKNKAFVNKTNVFESPMRGTMAVGFYWMIMKSSS